MYKLVRRSQQAKLGIFKQNKYPGAKLTKKKEKKEI